MCVKFFIFPFPAINSIMFENETITLEGIPDSAMLQYMWEVHRQEFSEKFVTSQGTLSLPLNLIEDNPIKVTVQVSNDCGVSNAANIFIIKGKKFL